MKKLTYSLVLMLMVLFVAVPAWANDGQSATNTKATSTVSDVVLNEGEELLTIVYKNQEIICKRGAIKEGDITYLPLREVLSIYGVETAWAQGEAETKVILTGGKQRYQLVMDLKKNEAFGLDKKVYMMRHVDDTVYMPVHFFVQLMNCNVQWDSAACKLTIKDTEKKKEATIFNPNNGGISYIMVMNLPEYEKTAAPTVSRSEGVSQRYVTAETGTASFYSKHLDGCRTASGERYRAAEMVAAHKTLPFGTVVRVHSLWNDKTVDVRIIDRGPYINGRIIDLSWAAATELSMLTKGIGPVSLEILYMPEK